MGRVVGVGRGLAGGESCFIIQPYKLRWSLTSSFARALVWISLLFDSQRRDIWWKASSFGRALGEFKGPSHYMQQKLVSRHHCGGKWNKPLIYERQRQGTLLYKGERGLRALPVSGSSMQTDSREGGGGRVGGEHSWSRVVCVFRLQRVRVYNREEGSKIETQIGSAEAKAAALTTR